MSAPLYAIEAPADALDLVDRMATLLDRRPLPQLTTRAVQYLEAMRTNPNGITSIEFPGQRLADGIFKLRRAGVEIETLHEAHGGDAPGHHARYVLRSRVVRLDAPRPPAVGAPVTTTSQVTP